MHSVRLNTLDQHVRALVRAADLLRQARTVEELAWAISNNLGVWITLNAVSDTHEAPTKPLRGKVRRMARYVIDSTLASGRVAPTDQVIESFIGVNERMADALRGLAAPVEFSGSPAY